MSMNKFMHPRNKYKIPPDFNELAINFPEFRKISTLELNGKVSVDFKHTNTVKVLTKVLLKKDFGLNISLPPDKLVPTLPLRLNYICWLEDIFAGLNVKTISGIDVGCGASCIYPLLSVRQNPEWKMLALESDEKSYDAAVMNVSVNSLQDRITVIKQVATDGIFSRIPQNQSNHFTMCNPPFYTSHEDFDFSKREKNRTGRRGLPKNAFTGLSNELVYDGGEVEFVGKMIDESLELKDRVQVYTSMLGHKRSVGEVIKRLNTAEITNYTTTEFCQGNTTRWGIAWTFTNFDLKNVPKYGSTPQAPIRPHSLKYDLPSSTEFDEMKKFLEETFATLKIEAHEISIEDDSVTWQIVARENTWSGQRRRRRQHCRDDDQEPEAKKSKVELFETAADPLVRSAAILTKSDGVVSLDLRFESGTAGKDGTHQILQFIINQVKLKGK